MRMLGDQLETSLDVLKGASNWAFDLPKLAERLSTSSSSSRVMNVVLLALKPTYYEGLKKCLTLNEDLINDDGSLLQAEQLKHLVDLIDQQYLNGDIGSRFSFWQRELSCKLDTVGTAVAHYSRRGIKHTISINPETLYHAFTEQVVEYACGIGHSNRLQLLITMLQHELSHLLAYSNWSGLKDEDHGVEFRAISELFFGHQGYTYDVVSMPPTASKGFQKQLGVSGGVRFFEEIDDTKVDVEEEQPGLKHRKKV